MSEIQDPVPVSIKIGREEVSLSYTVASLHYLTTKYEDLPGFLKQVGGNGKTGIDRVNPEFLGAVADFIYAGLYQPDDNGVDTSGWSAFKIMRMFKLTELTVILDSAWRAFNGGAPTVKATEGSEDDGPLS